jgi:membrane protein implicated in regulation of membrane protease activity
MMFVLFLTCAGLLFILLAAALWWRKRGASRAGLTLVGRVASVERELNPEGHVLIDGELWPARTLSGRRVGRGPAKVRVVGARGHLLEVEPVEPDGP